MRHRQVAGAVDRARPGTTMVRMTTPHPASPTPAALPALPTTAPRPGIEDAPQAERDGPFQLVLLDDDDHSYAYVIEMLDGIFGYGREKAYALAALVDAEGRVTIETAGYEQVTRHQQQIHGYGADPRIAHCRGSMSAIIEDGAGTGGRD